MPFEAGGKAGVLMGRAHARIPADPGRKTFYHPDYTVGSGIAPDPVIMP